jgi:hypothetical protein
VNWQSTEDSDGPDVLSQESIGELKTVLDQFGAVFEGVKD